MMISNYGDMAQSMLLRRLTSTSAQSVSVLTEELSTGRKADLREHLDGDFSSLARLERSLTMSKARGASNSAAAMFASAQQAALETVQNSLKSSGPDFLAVAATGETTQMQVIFDLAGNHLDQVVSALNSRVGGRALFAGAATQSPALVDPETLLADLSAALAGQTTAAGVAAAADAWFDTPGGGFDSLAYSGSQVPLSAFTLADGTDEALNVTARDQGLRDTIKGLALPALMGRGLLAGATAEQAALLTKTGGDLVNASDKVTAMRGRLGFSEERIEAASVRANTERNALEAARNDIAGADPFETAVRLQERELQLSMIYTLTARLSKLSLAAVLR